MTTAVPFHDLTVESLFVDARARRLVARAFDQHDASRPISVAEFSGVVCYRFDGDVLGTILFDIEETDPGALFKAHASALRAVATVSGGHAGWVASDDAAREFISTNAIRAFELSVSIGAPGYVWCRGFRAWAEEPHAGEHSGAAGGYGRL